MVFKPCVPVVFVQILHLCVGIEGAFDVSGGGCGIFSVVKGVFGRLRRVGMYWYAQRRPLGLEQYTLAAR